MLILYAKLIISTSNFKKEHPQTQEAPITKSPQQADLSEHPHRWFIIVEMLLSVNKSRNCKTRHYVLHCETHNMVIKNHAFAVDTPYTYSRIWHRKCVSFLKNMAKPRTQFALKKSRKKTEVHSMNVKSRLRAKHGGRLYGRTNGQMKYQKRSRNCNEPWDEEMSKSCLLCCARCWW